MIPKSGTQVLVNGEQATVVAVRAFSVLVRFGDRREKVVYEWDDAGPL